MGKVVTLGPVCVAQGGDSLVVVVGGGPDVSDHDGFAVAAQRVLQDARQLRVSVIRITRVNYMTQASNKST